MPRAGFYAIHSSKIKFGRDGVWYSDDEPITNARITRVFSQNLVRQDGAYFIQIGYDRAPVEVEDTPYVVRGIAGDADRGFEVELNDGSVESLVEASLQAGEDNALYCSVKRGAERARFLRSAYYQLAPFIDETEPGHFALRSQRQLHPIARA